MNARPAALTAVLFAGLVPAQTPQPVDPSPRIEWQRTLDDALAVQQATGLPLLIAVNMDGEVFNDRFAGTTYLDPAFVASTRGYVCVIASPTRHNDRDYDALGRRVECPRFPGCTCSEHQQIEPELFRRWFDGKRNAPRHVGVGADGKVRFDRFLDQSMQTAIDAIAEHRGTGAIPAIPDDVATLLTRRDAGARRALEQRYADGDDATRRAILTALPKATNDPADLLRLCLRDEDDARFALAAKALATLATPAMRIDIEDALARTRDAAAVGALVARLGALGASDPESKRLATHFDLDPAEPLPKPWSNAWSEPAFTDAREAIEAALDAAEARLQAAPDDETARLRLAIAKAAFGEHLALTGGKGPEFWFEDALQAARKIRAEALQPEAQAVIAFAAWQRSDGETAQQAMVQALAAANSERTPDPWLARQLLGVVLQRTAQQAYGRAQQEPTASLRAELQRTLQAVTLLRSRQAWSEGPLLAGAGLLEFGGRRDRAADLLGELAAAFPASPAVHERWRARLLVDRGAEALRQHYGRWLQGAADRPTAAWFAGYAALVAAEQHVRDRRAAEATAAYAAAVTHFTASAAGAPDYADSANHFAVLALAGRSLQHHLAGRGTAAVDDLLQAKALRAASLDEKDGLERTPRALAARIARELAAAGDTAGAGRLADY